MTDFSRRSEDPEIMDDLACEGAVVIQTLRELDFINHWLGGNAVTFLGVQRMLQSLPAGTACHIADLGCGSGDMLRRLARWGRGRSLSLTFTGIDANPHIIAYARSQSADYPEIQFEVVDIFSEDFRARRFDIVMGTLFFHHFNATQLSGFFRQVPSMARVGFLINDIHRHWLAYYSIRLLTAIFSRSAMVRYDAPLSVRRAFKRAELRQLLDGAGLKHASIEWKWAFRWLVAVPTKS